MNDWPLRAQVHSRDRNGYAEEAVDEPKVLAVRWIDQQAAQRAFRLSLLHVTQTYAGAIIDLSC